MQSYQRLNKIVRHYWLHLLKLNFILPLSLFQNFRSVLAVQLSNKSAIKKVLEGWKSCKIY